MDFNTELKNRIERTEGIITKYLPKEEGYGGRVTEAMNYSFMAGGKRIRPMLMIETHILCGGDGRLIAPFMAAIEMIHTYSLVHDDLPAMDGDELRRGKPSAWKQYDEAMAVLAGDGLLNYAAETALMAFDLAEDELDTTFVAEAMKLLFYHSGINGMIGGQCADVEAGKSPDVSPEQLIYIYKNKTAALIRASMDIGALLGGVDDDTLIAIDRAAYNIGIAFQIQDDILDVTSTEEELGKPIGSDDKNNKTTYVTVNGLDASAAEVERLSNEALDILKGFEVRNEFLEELVSSLIGRKA
ncbi:MAG: polyprenyl synthetase family protein [Lachnospiraceae bacterium]|nr:polyprenyl synthetase family protein [Lachnospiraceae bacterium]